MAKGSDNPYPSLLLVEQASAPATPAAGQARLYRGTDNKLYVVDDAGAVTQVGGGGGSAIRSAVKKRTAGNLGQTGTGVWKDVDNTLDITLTAAAGDVVEYGMSAFVGAEANTVAFDAVTVVAAAPVNSLGHQGAIEAGGNGVLAWYANASATQALGGSILYTLQSGDISAGSVTLRLRARPSSATSRTLSAVTATPLVVWAKVWTP